MSQLAPTPAPPYFAVVFTSVRSPADPDGYEVTAERMLELARQQLGFLGVESARGQDGLGITVSYWASLDAIRAWRAHAEHLLAQEQGRAKWYSRYALRVCRVERAWDFDADGR
jgi:heme-degrading monooxygenase HmoA